MPTPRQIVHAGLFLYPSLYRDPLDVLDHVFAVNGNGYEWENGELTPWEAVDFDNLTMDYDDLDSTKGWKADFIRDYGNEDRFALEDGAQRVIREWVEKNIDRILAAPLVKSYFGSDYRDRSYVTKHISTTYACGLNFPDDITKEWGDVLYAYLENWLVRLNYAYGVSRRQEDAIKHWPKEVQDARRVILAARERLYPLINNGKSYAEHVAECNALSKKLMEGLAKDDEA
jgi:hypothetical protein